MAENVTVDAVASVLRVASAEWEQRATAYVEDGGDSPGRHMVALATAVVREFGPLPNNREALEGALVGVISNASNYPEPAQPHILGRDSSKLRTKVVDAVLALAAAAPEPEPAVAGEAAKALQAAGRVPEEVKALPESPDPAVIEAMAWSLYATECRLLGIEPVKQQHETGWAQKNWEVRARAAYAALRGAMQ